MSPPQTPTIVIWPGDAGTSASLDLVGGKGLRLISLATNGIEELVPPFFIVASDIFRKIVARPDIAPLRKATLSGDELSDAAGRERYSDAVRNAILAVTLADDVAESIFAAFQTLQFSSYGGVAVRSSGVAEDGKTHSFAGQFDSILGITNQNDLLAAVKSCWASAFSARSIAYRQRHGLSMDDISMAVIVQIMVVGEVSGVMFTRAGPSQAPNTLISANWGLCEGVVSGLVATDEFSISHGDESIHTVIGDKQKKVMLGTGDGAATTTVSVPTEQQNSPSLTEPQAVQLHRLGQTIEASQGGPQDIEWTIRGDHIWVVQTRPITGIPQGSGKDEQIIWDNSNIVESYGGVTKPLTFSYIKYAYSVVYRQSCRISGIPEKDITSNAENFDNLLGSIRGRVYYNLKAWFTLLALFPGFNKNSVYMEQMLGLKESAEILTKRPRRTLLQKIRLGYRMLYNYLFIGTMIRRFERNFGTVSQDFGVIDLDQLSISESADLYHDMVGRLLYNWQAPLITDFLAMVFHGIMVDLTKKWEVDASGDISAELLGGGQPGPSMEVTLQLLGIADFIRSDETLMDLLMKTPAEACHNIIAQTECAQELAQLTDQYLQEYGSRCMNELKLEEPTLKDRPDRFYRLLKSYLSQDNLSVSALHHKERARYVAAKRGLKNRLPGTIKRFVYLRAIHLARRHINNRELMRLRRTQGQDMLRRIFNRIGSGMVERQVLAEGHDVYLLQISELIGYIDGSVSDQDIGEIIINRRDEYERYLNEDDPPARIETHSSNGHSYEPSTTLNEPLYGKSLRGIPIAGGTVSGTARVIKSLSEDLDLADKILVIKQADPGWVHLFPAVRGLLVERGSALSHAAIIARELGLPTIVNISGLTSTVKDGDEVELDAARGTLRVISNDR